MDLAAVARVQPAARERLRGGVCLAPLALQHVVGAGEDLAIKPQQCAGPGCAQGAGAGQGRGCPRPAPPRACTHPRRRRRSPSPRTVADQQAPRLPVQPSVQITSLVITCLTRAIVRVDSSTPPVTTRTRYPASRTSAPVSGGVARDVQHHRRATQQRHAIDDRCGAGSPGRRPCAARPSITPRRGRTEVGSPRSSRGTSAPVSRCTHNQLNCRGAAPFTVALSQRRCAASAPRPSGAPSFRSCR